MSAITPTTTFDPVALTVVDNYLTSCCRDMGVTMMTTAYSPIFNESLDFSCVIFDPSGNMLAQAEFCPSQIGTIKFTVEWTIEELGLDGFDEGDVVLHNDPYRGSGFLDAVVAHRSSLEQGELIAGPAVIEEEGSTLFVEPEMTLERTEQGALVIETGADA